MAYFEQIECPVGTIGWTKPMAGGCVHVLRSRRVVPRLIWLRRKDGDNASQVPRPAKARRGTAGRISVPRP